MTDVPLPASSPGDPADFIGRGISFPLRVDATGSIAMTSGPEDINASVRMVLGTAPGERLMRPEFGCRIWELLFEPINANTLGLMGEAVREAIARWEPRVELDDVRIEPVDGAVGEVRIELDYVVRSTNDRRNLVYPFYVIPPERGAIDADTGGGPGRSETSALSRILDGRTDAAADHTSDTREQR